jgi:hypothetical protein
VERWLLVALIALWIYWHASVKKWFTGPKHTVEAQSQEALAHKTP